MKKSAVVVFSGGMDSSLCLALAVEKYGKENVLALSFSYGQRHSAELDRAKEISTKWEVDHKVVEISCLNKITNNALLDESLEIKKKTKKSGPTTLVVGRNGLMARVASIHAESIGAECIYMGVIEVEESNSGYRDCSRLYMDIVQKALQIDFGNPRFEIKTPLVFMTKEQTMELGLELGVIEYLLEKTISCYQGIDKFGCGRCPACLLRNDGLKKFVKLNPEVEFSYRKQILES